MPALRAIYPSLTSQFIMLTLTTSIASAISAYELTSVGQATETNTFRSFEVYGHERTRKVLGEILPHH